MDLTADGGDMDSECKELATKYGSNILRGTSSQLSRAAWANPNPNPNPNPSPDQV
jgi:hypothetical protein